MNSDKHAHAQVLRSAGVMSIAVFLSRILGLVREQAFAILFGAGDATDAYNVAFRIPNLLRDLFAEGAMSASLVPTFTRARAEEGDARAWRVAGLVFRVLFVIVGILAALGMIFAPELVGFYASAYKQVPGKFELTVTMTRIMFPFFPLVALAAAYMGILNACGFFFIPALSSALFNLVSITFGVLLSTYLIRSGHAHPITGMAYGVVAGGAVQAFCQLPLLYRSGYKWERKPKTKSVPWYQDVALKRMLWLMIPGTIGLAATQVNILVNSVLATSQGTGAVSWLGYAFRLMQFPIGIFGVSLASATLPRVSQQWVERDYGGVSRTLESSLKQVLAINLCASAGLAFLGIPIVRMLFQYGRFTAFSTEQTALALAVYSLGLAAYSAVKVLVPACYAMGNTRIAVLSSMISVGFTIVLNLLLVKPLGFSGLALGTSAAAVLNCLFLVFATRNKLRAMESEFDLPGLLWCFFRYLLLAGAMGTVLKLSHGIMDAWFFEQAWTLPKSVLALTRIAKMAVIMVEGVLFLWICGKVFRLQEINQVLELFEKKIKKKLS